VPIYEYRCRKCDAEFEALVRHDQRSDPQRCPDPSCGAKDTKKLVSRTSFSLRGTGWAKDGYAG